MKYLVAYDIACPKRLRRVGRVLERLAVRCQKSVYLHRGGVASVARLLDEAAKLIDPAEDIIQAWRLAADETADGLSRGTSAQSHPPAIVLGDRFRHAVARPAPAPENPEGDSP